MLRHDLAGLLDQLRQIGHALSALLGKVDLWVCKLSWQFYLAKVTSFLNAEMQSSQSVAEIFTLYKE